MVNVLASSVVERWFDPQSGQTRVYEIGIAEREMLYIFMYTGIIQMSPVSNVGRLN